MTNQRTIEELRSKWQKEEPFYYHMDHQAAGILFSEIDRLRAAHEPEDGKIAVTNSSYAEYLAKHRSELLAEKSIRERDTCAHDWEARVDRDGIFVLCPKCTVCIPVNRGEKHGD